MCSWCSVWVNFVSRYSMYSGSWVQVASSECIYQGNMPLCSYPPILVSCSYHGLPVPDNIKVGRVCSTDVYSVLTTKAEMIFMTVLCYSRKPLIIILVHAPNFACGLCYNYTHAQTVCTRCFSSPSAPGMRLTSWCLKFRYNVWMILCPTFTWLFSGVGRCFHKEGLYKWGGGWGNNLVTRWSTDLSSFYPGSWWVGKAESLVSTVRTCV